MQAITSGSLEYLAQASGRAEPGAHVAAAVTHALQAGTQGGAAGLRPATHVHRRLQLSALRALAASQFHACFRERRPAVAAGQTTVTGHTKIVSNILSE